MIREVTAHDVEAITRIYNHYVLHTTITFETEAVSVEEMKYRILHIVEHYPYLVYEVDGKVVGYCYAHQWKSKAAYRFSAESTIYLDPEYKGKGIGKQMMCRLIEECRERGLHALIACITAGNGASDALHLGLGFEQVSHFKRVGIKFDTWLDVFDYELLL